MTVERARLRWLCRRGVRELDIVLMTWLEHHHDKATEGERTAFVELLAKDDPELFDLLFGKVAAQTPAQRQLLMSLRRIAASHDRTEEQSTREETGPM